MKTFQGEQKITFSFAFQLLNIQWVRFPMQVQQPKCKGKCNVLFNLKYFFLTTKLNFVHTLYRYSRSDIFVFSPGQPINREQEY